jgi:uncharacterized protein YwgA
MTGENVTTPVFKRQQFLVAFIHSIKGGCSTTDLQKLMFLYLCNQKMAYYDFIPYLYGSYSFQLAQDIDTLRQDGVA